MPSMTSRMLRGLPAGGGATPRALPAAPEHPQEGAGAVAQRGGPVALAAVDQRGERGEGAVEPRGGRTPRREPGARDDRGPRRLLPGRGRVRAERGAVVVLPHDKERERGGDPVRLRVVGGPDGGGGAHRGTGALHRLVLALDPHERGSGGAPRGARCDPNGEGVGCLAE